MSRLSVDILARLTLRTAYVNYPDLDLLEGDEWKDRYYGSNYGRLAALKREVDVDNVFSFPLAVEP
jgi:hypothetical protein